MNIIMIKVELMVDIGISLIVIYH